MRERISWQAVASAVLMGVAGFCTGASLGLPGTPFNATYSALWAAWAQALGSIGAILIAAAVPAVLYIQQRRADRRKELANAKIAVAFALDGLANNLWHLEGVALPPEPQEFMHGLKDIIDGTSVSDNFKDALKNADAYPALVDDMAAYMMRAQQINARAQNIVEFVGADNFWMHSGPHLIDEVAALMNVGQRLQQKMQEMQDEPMH